MARGFIFMALLFITAASYAGERYEPVTAKELATKVPNFFFVDYQFEPEPGKRLWLRVNESTWIERYPSGKETKFELLGRATVDQIEGVVVERAEDQGLHAFIPDKGGEPMELKFREVGQEGEWSLLGEMKKVE